MEGNLEEASVCLGIGTEEFLNIIWLIIMCLSLSSYACVANMKEILLNP